jgi:hypothetical protein
MLKILRATTKKNLSPGRRGARDVCAPVRIFYFAYKPSVTRKAKNLLCCCCKEVQFLLLDDNELNIGVSMKQEN